MKNKKQQYDYFYNQILLFTNKILKLNNHLKKNKKDFNTKRFLLKKVSLRKKFLKYIKINKKNIYLKIKKKLNKKKTNV
ncbi:MAG: 30S ribosomal protein S15 [Candidatus Shikimatogenerans bostrichidophilus]|nr:MAG: 30S ribosomal protein S15 [Candidatus Shikimatogenerans bostrichidophilus]